MVNFCCQVLLLVAASLVLFSTEQFEQVSAERIDISVIPDEWQTSLCPEKPALCYTLNELIYYNFHSNTTVTLLPGVHKITLPGTVRVNIADNIVIVGQDFVSAGGQRRYVVIECVEKSGFEFNQVTNLTLANITIRGCIFESDLSLWSGAIHILNSMNVYIRSISIGYMNVSSESALKYGVFTSGLCGLLNITGLNLVNNGLYISLPRSMKTFKMFVENSHLLHSSIYVDASDESDTNKSITFKSISVNGNVFRSGITIRGANFVELEDVKITGNYGQFSMWIVYSVVKISGCFWIYNNTGGVAFIQSRVNFSRNSSVEFSNNILESSFGQNFKNILCFGTALCIRDSTIHILENNHIRFERNLGHLTGGLILIRSTVMFNGTSTLDFIENQGGKNGGAMALFENSQFLFTFSTTTMRFVRNEAQERGGAIYVDDSGYIDKTSYKLTMPFINTIVDSDTSSVPWLEFVNNTAGIAGDTLYGGWIDWFDFSKHFYFIISQFFHFFDEELGTSATSMITSNPTRVCMCNDNIPNCSLFSHSVDLFPGQLLVLDAVAVGQRLGPVPAVVQAEFEIMDKQFIEIESKIVDPGNRKQLENVGIHCTALSYEIRSVKHQERLMLSVVEDYAPSIDYVRSAGLERHPNFSTQFEQLSITINLKPCAPGFSLNHTLKRCTCQEALLEHGMQCNMTSLDKVYRTASKWINETTFNCYNHSNVIVHDHCPFDYCIKENHLLDLRYPNGQCAFNRTNILCGACRPGLSHMFGTSKCKECSHVWLLLAPVFALLGLLLVAMVFLCNLTVSVGTIHGLIFYANIVRVNQSIFFPPDTTNSFLNWFIAWINLDFGIEACFYNGMDAYAKTWLQFLFPLYIWFILIAIILLSRRFDTIAKLCGNNAVPVLATLILLSYAKLLRIIITVFQSTPLDYPDGNYTRVWLYDGNIDYLRGKHIPLFIAAFILLVFLSLPYTAILLTIQWLQKLSEHRVLFWVNRLKPLFDAYTGPYKDTHRYWTGLLLLVRVLLFLVFSLNVGNDPSLNLVTISIVIMIMGLYLSMIGGVYKTRVNNLIELSFILNLGVLSVATFYHIHTDKSKREITIASVSIALVTFVFITLKELFVRCFLKNNRNKNKLTSFPKNTNELKLFIEAMFPQSNSVENDDQKTDDTKSDKREVVLNRTSVQLREPLLDYTCEQD